MNYVKRLNQLEIEKQDLFYKIISGAFSECENQMLKVYDILNKNSSKEAIIKTETDGSNTVLIKEDICCDLINELNNISKKYVKLTADFVDSLIDECISYVTNEKEFLMLVKNRRLYIQKKYLTILKNLIRDLYGDSVKELLDFFNNFESQMLKNFNKDILINEEIELTINNNKTIFKKIFNYKKMEKLAFENEYFYKWSNGSHNIYENINTNKIIVIPQHELGLGLSIKIQKQIYENKKIAI